MNTVRINGQDYTSSLSDAEIAFIGPLSLPTGIDSLSEGIVKHEEDVSELNSNLTSLVKIKDYSASYEVGANASVNVSASDLNMSTPSGYSPVAVLAVQGGNNSVVPRNFYGNATGTGVALSLRNVSANTVTGTAKITVMYMKSTSVS